MKLHNDHKQNKKRWPLLIVLLAVVCIGCAELIACAWFAPATFARITAPVKTAVTSVVEKGQAAATSLCVWYDEYRERHSAIQVEPVDAQAASEPILENTAPILDPAITELIVDGEHSILTGGIVPVAYYNQGDALWADEPYGSDDIGRYGCGPTAMAMAIQSLTDEVIDPVRMAVEAVDAGHWARKQGSYLSIVSGLAADYGLIAHELEEKTPDAMRDALLSGKLLVALMGPGHFTTGGHFILIRGITLQGTVLVADPNSTERSLQEWEPQLILDELSDSTDHGAPLWTLAIT